ncbi:fungal-specific transcription factor domain-containing protein [Exophiala viscosa]|uniref:Fungal-specific transcription factor domain-containing protein n=1 Tax=Exophiala viscosa TaxID=2486360 RepID=A0AAN6DWI8_9EURO|nr:fungal-specific transcription factor domain-containing protein [Exophiala viscosa]
MRNRSAARVQLACKRCRSRKVRCSGEWPCCRDCLRRSLPCSYPSAHPAAPEEQLRQKEASLPGQDHVRQVVDIFFDYYGSTFFTFLVRHRFMEDLSQDKVPLRMLFSILALASRFHEPFYSLYKGTLEASEHFAELARAELATSFDDINILDLQCYLILALVEMGCGHEHRAWILLGVAIRMVHILRLMNEEKFERKDWADAESKRRSLWCCFILDKLISNGSDRPPAFDSASITTLLPAPDADFVLGRETRTTTLAHPNQQESLLSYTIRIVDVLGSVVSWSGAGGRDMDDRCPWDPTSPFFRFDKALDDWEDLLPRYMQLHPETLAAHVACGQGNLFALMHLLNYHARCYLHREYIPFIPPQGYDPANGPCDGPPLARRPSLPEPPEYWFKSIQTGIQSARRISTFFHEMVGRDLAPWAYPFSGICLMTAGTFHACCSFSTWKSCEQYMGVPAKKLLAEDLRKMIQLQEIWALAAHWIKVLRRYYERVGIDNNCDPNSEANGNIPRDEAIAAEGILQLHEVVVHSISAVTDAPQGISVHLPSKEFDIYALLEMDPGDSCSEPPLDDLAQPQEEQLRDVDEEELEIAGVDDVHEMITEDIYSFEDFLFSWK